MTPVDDWFSTDGWDDTEEYSNELDKQREQSQNFILDFWLDDGESAVVRFLNEEPVTFRQHYIPGAKNEKFYTCLEGTTDEDGNRVQCPFCSAGNKPSFRGGFLIVDRSKDTWESNGEQREATNQIKLFTQGIKVMKVLKGLAEKRDLTQWDMEITRTGTGTETQYNFIPEEEFELSEEVKEKVEDVKDGRTIKEVIIEEIEPVSLEKALQIMGGRGDQKQKYKGGDEESVPY